MGAHARVDTAGGVVLVARAVEVAGSEANGGQARVDVGEEVVVVGDAELAGIFPGVVIRVADERALPLRGWVVSRIVEEFRGLGEDVRGR